MLIEHTEVKNLEAPVVFKIKFLVRKEFLSVCNKVIFNVIKLVLPCDVHEAVAKSRVSNRKADNVSTVTDVI